MVARTELTKETENQTMILKLKLFKRYLWVLMRSIFFSDGDIFNPHGVPVKLPRNTDISIRYFLARGRPYEAPEARMVQKYISKGNNVIELGGCYGVISALIQKKIGPNAKHIIVEANPSLAAICAINANANKKVNNAEVVVAAVDYSGKKEISFAPGANAHVGHVALEGEEGFTVPTTTLAEQAKKLEGNSYVLVCDVEGAELDLFQNERKSLSRVHLLILETHLHIYPKKIFDLQQLLQNIEKLGLIEIERSESVICFASNTAMKDLTYFEY